MQKYIRHHILHYMQHSIHHFIYAQQYRHHYIQHYTQHLVTCVGAWWCWFLGVEGMHSDSRKAPPHQASVDTGTLPVPTNRLRINVHPQLTRSVRHMLKESL